MMNNNTSSAKVCHVSTSTVLPATQKNRTPRKIELSQMDFRPFRRLYVQFGLLFAKPETSPESDRGETNKILISNLKTSLSQTLDYFFPLAGRLAMTKHDDDGTMSFYIDCNSAGAEFIHAVANITVADLLEPTYTPDIIGSFFTLDGVPNYQGVSLPLLSVQVTELNDGIFVALSLNHSVCDGSSISHFINSWSQISRGGGTHKIHPPAVLEPRWLPVNTSFPIHLPFSSIDQLSVEKYIPSPQLRHKTFHFTPPNIAKLKGKASCNEHGATTFSSLQVVTAHVWVAVTRARRLHPNEKVTYSCAINCRGRLDPPLPNGYFGNAVRSGIATAKAGDLLGKGLSFGASLINQMVESCTNTVIQREWESWVENPVMPSCFDLTSHPNFVVGGSPKFNFQRNDFGWGPPLVCRYGSNYKYDGRLMADSGPVDGAITIGICLPLQILRALENDVEFMENACTVLPPEYSITKTKALPKL